MSEAHMNVDDGGGRQKRVRVDYPANSQKAKLETPAERAKQDKVVEGVVKQRKPSLASRLVHDFVAEDGGSVWQYVVMEVLLPAAKNTISDVVSQGIERLLYGDARPTRSGSNRPGYTNYSSRAVRSSAPIADPRPQLSRQARAAHDFDEVIIQSRAEAETVIDRLRDLIDQYEVATVSDLYDLVGLTGEFTDDKWGWYDLRSATVRAIRGGYLLSLPRTQAII